MNDFDLASYDYELPQRLIAQTPVKGPRSSSKLLVYNAKTGEVAHKYFFQLPNILSKDFTIVFNESKVFPCRLIGHKNTGGGVEVFVLSLHNNEDNLINVLLKSSGKKKLGDKIFFGVSDSNDDSYCEIKKKYEDETFGVCFNLKIPLENFLNENALTPLPPYIRGGIPDLQDKESYQTIYAKTLGSVAAPTAGLHFDQDLFYRLDMKGHQFAKVMLHVGLGTFLPVKTADIREHQMHREVYRVESPEWEKIAEAQHLLAVGSTTLRVLESIARMDNFKPGVNFSTDIFLHPEQKKAVKSINALLTNFHLPKSTLLMLVASLIGRNKTLELYELAIREHYRFFSYGDAMLILR